MSDKEKHTFGFSPGQSVKTNADTGEEEKKKTKGRTKNDAVAPEQPKQDGADSPEQADSDILAQ